MYVLQLWCWILDYPFGWKWGAGLAWFCVDVQLPAKWKRKQWIEKLSCIKCEQSLGLLEFHRVYEFFYLLCLDIVTAKMKGLDAVACFWGPISYRIVQWHLNHLFYFSSVEGGGSKKIDNSSISAIWSAGIWGAQSN